MASASTSKRSSVWFALAVGGLLVAAYLPALRGGFIWDDDGHVTKEALRSLHGLWLIWTEVRATQQYYPLLHSTFWLEHRLWGDAPLGYHLLGLIFHAGSAAMVYAVL